MSILLISPVKDFATLKKEINKIDPDIDVQIWPAIIDKHNIQFAVSWKHRHGIFEMFPNLKSVMSYGAGVDHLLGDHQLNDLTICRFDHPSLAQQLSEYVLTTCLTYKNSVFDYLRNRIENKWEAIDNIGYDSLSIGILGLGSIGTEIARKLTLNGFTVFGLVKNARDQDESIAQHIYTHEDLDEFLGQSNIIVNALPLTPSTEGILDLDLFKKLKDPSFVINVGRGAHLIDEDLIYALDTHVLKGATLDVFNEEPLPENHSFWSRNEIFITPHIAAITYPNVAAEQIVENYKRITSGLDPLNKIDKDKGY